MELSKQHEAVRKLAREFAENELTKEILDQVEETAEFPEEIYQKMAKCGFLGIKAPREYGGAGFDHLAYVIVMEEIARVSSVASIFVSSANSLASSPIVLTGTEEQKQKYLPGLFRGEYKMCFALTEPGAGSDAGGVTTTAVLNGEDFILNGRKTFITGAPLCKYGVVYAKTDKSLGTRGISAFILDLESEGVSFGKPEDKMGAIGCATTDIVMENVRVPRNCLLGSLNKGFTNAMKTLDVGRMGVAAQSLGIAQAALDEAINYAKERKQFGKPIAKFQAISFLIAQMATKVETMRLLTYKAARVKDSGQDASKIAAMAKFYCSETCNEVVYDALQVHGGYGYIKDYKIERLYRDARITSIYEGTSQVQQMVIAGQVLK